MQILASSSVLFTNDGASLKFSTNSHETDNSVVFKKYAENKPVGLLGSLVANSLDQRAAVICSAAWWLCKWATGKLHLV
jgi:hypothetical protein